MMFHARIGARCQAIVHPFGVLSSFSMNILPSSSFFAFLPPVWCRIGAVKTRTDGIGLLIHSSITTASQIGYNWLVLAHSPAVKGDL
jgi:hypothetical protein